MNIKKSHLFIITFLCVAVPSTNAQSLKNEIEILEATYGIKKKQVVEQVMNLSGKEAMDFWLIYEDYENKRSVLGQQRLFLLHDYMVAYPTLSDAKASEIASRCFKNDDALDRLHKRYYKKLRKSLSPLHAAQFLQVEGYLQNIVRIQIQSQLPFIGEIVTIVNNAEP